MDNVFRPSDPSKLYEELSVLLLPHREENLGSKLFVVEGSAENPRVGIKYPGRKLKKRNLTRPRADSVLWANLLDFEVVPFQNGEALQSTFFTYSNLLKDFEANKKGSREFWEMLEVLLKTDQVVGDPPDLPGIDSRQFLEMLKWLWIQEDLNYRLTWEEVGSSIPYRLETKNGSLTKGAGRFKFYAALLLVKHHGFDAQTVGRIIP